MIAGDGIPAFFWEASIREGDDIYDVGARNASSDDENFSWTNTSIAEIDGEVAGMVLAYRLPDASHKEDVSQLPEFIVPFIELEECVPDSFYINMVAAYPEYRGMGIGTRLMQEAVSLARRTGCDQLSLQVFDENEGAVRLYQRLGYQVIETRDVIPHECHPHHGKILLMTKPCVQSSSRTG